MLVMLVKIRHAIVETDLGWVGLVLSERGVRAVTLPAPSRAEALESLHRLAPAAGEPLPASEAAALSRRLRALLSGDVDGLDLALDLEGTPFQRSVWQAVAEIPRGHTRSYGWIAERIGRPGAARAVGRAVGANPAPLLVPCHRVLAAGGGIGGFAGGPAMKRALLTGEGIAIAG